MIHLKGFFLRLAVGPFFSITFYAPVQLRHHFRFGPPLDELEAFGLVVWQARFEKHRVHTELRVQQRHVAIHLDEEVDALVALVEVRVVVRQCLRATGAAESPARRDLRRARKMKRNKRMCWLYLIHV